VDGWRWRPLSLLQGGRWWCYLAVLHPRQGSKQSPCTPAVLMNLKGELGMQRYGTTVMGVEAWFGDGETVSWGCRWGSFIGIRVRVGEEVQLTAVTECDLGIIHKFILIRSDFGYKLRSLILLDSIFGSACEGEVHHGDDSGMHPQKQTAMGGAKMVDDS
jgi:hypothetical protein